MGGLVGTFPSRLMDQKGSALYHKILNIFKGFLPFKLRHDRFLIGSSRPCVSIPSGKPSPLYSEHPSKFREIVEIHTFSEKPRLKGQIAWTRKKFGSFGPMGRIGSSNAIIANIGTGPIKNQAPGNPGSHQESSFPMPKSCLMIDPQF